MITAGMENSWSNSLNLLRETYFWPELSGKKSFWDRLVYKSCTEELKTNFLNVDLG